MNDQFNWKKFVLILGLSCLFAGIGMGFIVHYTTKAVESPATSSLTSGAITVNQTDLKIKGNKRSKIYHLPGCASYDRISPENIVWFKTHEEAQAAGYRMARNC